MMGAPPMSSPRAQYEAWHASLDVDEQADAPWHRLLKPQLDLAGRRVLEIASGRGGLAVWMATRPDAERPRMLVAADFSHTALAAARGFASRAGAPVAFAQADLMALPWADGTFDAVVSCETLEHTPDPRRALGELHRVLRAGGVLYLTMPNYFGVTGLYRVYREMTGRPWQEAGQPINHPLRSTAMRSWLRRAGFAIVATHGAGHYLPIPGREPVRVHALDRIGALRYFAQHVLFIARKTSPAR